MCKLFAAVSTSEASIHVASKCCGWEVSV